MIASTQTNHPLADPNAGAPVEQACARLQAAGLRITQPRVAILQALTKRGQPASIEQLHEDLAGTSCDLVTVYRCLAAFQELGLVRRCFLENGTSLYQFQLGGESAYHILTRETNRVEPVEATLAAEISAVMLQVEAQLKARGYTGISHLVEFFANAPVAASTPSPAAPARAANVPRPTGIAPDSPKL